MGRRRRKRDGRKRPGDEGMKREREENEIERERKKKDIQSKKEERKGGERRNWIILSSPCSIFEVCKIERER